MLGQRNSPFAEVTNSKTSWKPLKNQLGPLLMTSWRHGFMVHRVSKAWGAEGGCQALAAGAEQLSQGEGVLGFVCSCQWAES